MAGIRFKSSLTVEQIEENFKNVVFFSGIMDGLNEALAYEKDTTTAETFARKQSTSNDELTTVAGK